MLEDKDRKEVVPLGVRAKEGAAASFLSSRGPASRQPKCPGSFRVDG